MRNDVAPEKLDQYVKTNDDKKKLEHLYEHKSLINVIIRIAELSCRRCKAMVLKRIQQGKNIAPSDFCAFCAKKHESSFDKINKTLEVEESD